MLMNDKGKKETKKECWRTTISLRCPMIVLYSARLANQILQ